MSAYTGQIDPVTGETIDAAAAAAPTPEEQEREALELLKELEAAKVDESEDREPWSPPPLELKPLVDESSCANVETPSGHVPPASLRPSEDDGGLAAAFETTTSARERRKNHPQRTSPLRRGAFAPAGRPLPGHARRSGPRRGL